MVNFRRRLAAAAATLTSLLMISGLGAGTASGGTAGSSLMIYRASGTVSVISQRHAGYLWSTSAAGGPVSTFYSFNTTGGTEAVNHPAGGEYIAGFPGLGNISGNFTFDVTTYGAAVICFAGEAGQIHGILAVFVICRSPAGTIQDARFDLVVSGPPTAPRGVFDYALISNPSRSGTLTGPFEYNSSHKVNSVKHLGTGRYQVTMPGPSTTGTTGTVKVSPLIASLTLSGDCEIASWHGSRTGEVIYVDCFSASGAPSDQRFAVTYTRGNNLMGLNGATYADAYASRPATANYRPATQDDSHHGAQVTVRHLSSGNYLVYLTGSEGLASNGGDVQVSTVGSTDDHCRVDSWSHGTTPFAFVSCMNNSGQPADSPFTIQWVVA